MTKKKRLGALAVLLGLVIIGWLWLSGAFGNDNLQQLKDEPIETLDVSMLDDGVYTGTKHYTDAIYMTVAVTVTNHSISAIEIVADETARGDRVLDLTDVIISDQSLEVDAVSGATISSLLLVHAVQDAIKEPLQ